MSESLTPAQMAQLRTRLESERADLLGLADGRKLAAGDPESDPDPEDVQDHASREVRHRDAFGVSDRARARLGEIDAALARMSNGSYGWCEETGDPIPWARLLAEPTTRFTVEALEELEAERAHARTTGDGDAGPY